MPDKTTLTIRDHDYPLDDIYCYANGWYNPAIPRESLVNNFTWLEEVSERSCEKLSKTVPGYESLTLGDLGGENVDDSAELSDLIKAGGGAVSDKLVKGMLLHAAIKCLLRGEQGIFLFCRRCATYIYIYIYIFGGTNAAVKIILNSDVPNMSCPFDLIRRNPPCPPCARRIPRSSLRYCKLCCSRMH